MDVDPLSPCACSGVQMLAYGMCVCAAASPLVSTLRMLQLPAPTSDRHLPHVVFPHFGARPRWWQLRVRCRGTHGVILLDPPPPRGAPPAFASAFSRRSDTAAAVLRVAPEAGCSGSSGAQPDGAGLTLPEFEKHSGLVKQAHWRKTVVIVEVGVGV